MPDPTDPANPPAPSTPTPTPEAFAARRAAVLAEIARAAKHVGRDPADVTLIAVGKMFGAPAMQAALAAGQRVFGENRVQEAQGKWPDLKAAHPDLRLHLIGPLQTNKAKEAVALFDVIESVDRTKLVDALARAADRLGRCPDLLIQVNTGAEAQKAGAAAADLPDLIDRVRALGLPLAGLMCLPPVDDDPAVHFGFLHALAKRHDLTGLSMGMSNDYAVAVEMGATHVRVGTALFGPRPKPPSG